MKTHKEIESFDPSPTKTFMKERDLSQKQMAKLCGFSVATLKKLLKGQMNISMDVVIKILVTLKIKSVELFGY